MIITPQGVQLKSLIKVQIKHWLCSPPWTWTEAFGFELKWLFIYSLWPYLIWSCCTQPPTSALVSLPLSAFAFTIIYNYLGSLAVFWFLIHLFSPPLKKNINSMWAKTLLSCLLPPEKFLAHVRLKIFLDRYINDLRVYLCQMLC